MESVYGRYTTSKAHCITVVLYQAFKVHSGCTMFYRRFQTYLQEDSRIYWVCEIQENIVIHNAKSLASLGRFRAHGVRCRFDVSAPTFVHYTLTFLPTAMFAHPPSRPCTQSFAALWSATIYDLSSIKVSSLHQKSSRLTFPLFSQLLRRKHVTISTH